MQYPPPYGPPGYRPPFPGAPPPGMHPSGMPYAPPPGPMHGMAPPMQRPPSYHGAPITKKTTLYVGKIAHTVTDDTMQSLLSACGELVSWKPMKDADTQAPKGFGFAEFQEADGVLRAVQILQGLDVDGQQLTVKPDTATQRYLDNYLIKHPELVTQGNEEQLSKVMEIISSLAATRAADKAASEFLANVGMGEGVGAAPTAGAGATGGEAPVPAAAPEMSEAARKRSREEREAAERAYRDALRDWERHERDRMKLLEADRERERRAEAERARVIRMDLQGGGGDDAPRWKRPLYKDSRYAAERRRRRQRELEDDDVDRRKEEEEAAEKMPTMTASPGGGGAPTTTDPTTQAAANGGGDGGPTGPANAPDGAASAPAAGGEAVDPDDPIYKAMMAAAQQHATPVATPAAAPAVGAVHQEEEKTSVAAAKSVVLPARAAPVRFTKPAAAKVRAFDEDDEDQPSQRRPLVPIKYTAEELAAVHTGPRLADDNDDDEGPSGGVAEPGAGGSAAASQKPVDIKSIADSIPTTKEGVFAAPVDWGALDRAGPRMLSTLGTWVGKKVAELLGEEEPSLIEFVVGKLKEHTGAQDMLQELREVLDEEAEGFVLRLYRTVLYETKKAAAGL